MDYYTVIFLNPTNGNRYVFEGIQAEVHNRHEFADVQSQMGFKTKVPTATWLDIILSIPNSQDIMKNIETFRNESLHENLYLNFKDIHPNLIRGVIKSITADSKNIGIRFKGNVTDKEYLDYVTEVSNQLQAYQYHFKASTDNHSIEPQLDSIQPESEPIETERKVTVVKRKLTF